MVLPRHSSNGRALWGIHAVWVTVLDDWIRKNTALRETEKSWRGIEFDKFAHVLHLTWNALQEQKRVSFRSVYYSADGVHGPGPALERRDQADRHVHALDAIDHIQGILQELTPNIHLFDLRVKTYDQTRQFSVLPGQPRAYSMQHLSDTLRPGWEPKDVTAVRAIASLMSKLTAEEIRCLGTHQTKEGTLAALEYNVFVHLFHRLMEECSRIERPSPSSPATQGKKTDLPSLESVIDEIERKSYSNQKAYRRGRDKLVSAQQNGDTFAAVALKQFDAPDTIWANGVIDWRKVGRKMQKLHAYLVALRNGLLPQPLPEDPEVRGKRVETIRDENAQGNTALETLAREGTILPKLPTVANETFAWSELYDSILLVFDSLPGRTPYFDRYKKWAEKFRTGVAGGASYGS